MNGDTHLLTGIYEESALSSSILSLLGAWLALPFAWLIELDTTGLDVS